MKLCYVNGTTIIKRKNKIIVKDRDIRHKSNKGVNIIIGSYNKKIRIGNSKGSGCFPFSIKKLFQKGFGLIGKAIGLIVAL